MAHSEVVIGEARKLGTCERCRRSIDVGERVAHYPLTKSTAHIECHWMARRAEWSK
jgi:hypothetical protein